MHDRARLILELRRSERAEIQHAAVRARSHIEREANARQSDREFPRRTVPLVDVVVVADELAEAYGVGEVVRWAVLEIRQDYTRPAVADCGISREEPATGHNDESGLSISRGNVVAY